MSRVELKCKTIDECEILEKRYRKNGYILVSLLNTNDKRHLFDDGYYDIVFKNK